MTTVTAQPLATDYGRASRRARARQLPLRTGRWLIGSLAVILAVLTVTFFVTRVFAPGPDEPVPGRRGQRLHEPGRGGCRRAKIHTALGLNGSLLQQYGRFL